MRRRQTFWPQRCGGGGGERRRVARKRGDDLCLALDTASYAPRRALITRTNSDEADTMTFESFYESAVLGFFLLLKKSQVAIVGDLHFIRLRVERLNSNSRIFCLDDSSSVGDRCEPIQKCTRAICCNPICNLLCERPTENAGGGSKVGRLAAPLPSSLRPPPSCDCFPLITAAAAAAARSPARPLAATIATQSNSPIARIANCDLGGHMIRIAQRRDSRASIARLDRSPQALARCVNFPPRFRAAAAPATVAVSSARAILRSFAAIKRNAERKRETRKKSFALASNVAIVLDTRLIVSAEKEPDPAFTRSSRREKYFLQFALLSIGSHNHRVVAL